ncbi:hypothetical protein [Salmonella phage SSBI34]|nr:hypothetical protein [Salmonella phage SSBI34]
MQEMLTVATLSGNRPLFSIPPTEIPGSFIVRDLIKGTEFRATSGASVVKDDLFGERVLSMNGGHWEQLGLVDLGISGKPFVLELEIFLFSYPSGEGAIFSQLNPNTGAGTFGLTMYNGQGGPGRLSFFWTEDGSLGSRKVITSEEDVPLNQPVKVAISWNGSEMKIIMNGETVASGYATRLHSAALPIGIGGHYGTQSYNMRGMLKNITLKRIEDD